MGGNQYEDISTEVPTPAEWQRAQDPEREVQPTRRRISMKRPMADLQAEDQEMDPEDTAGTSQPSNIRRVQSSEPDWDLHVNTQYWWQKVPHSAWLAEHTSFWADEAAAVEVEIPLPDSRRGLGTGHLGFA